MSITTTSDIERLTERERSAIYSENALALLPRLNAIKEMPKGVSNRPKNRFEPVPTNFGLKRGIRKVSLRGEPEKSTGRGALFGYDARIGDDLSSFPDSCSA
jgi:hypothetical protein